MSASLNVYAVTSAARAASTCFAVLVRPGDEHGVRALLTLTGFHAHPESTHLTRGDHVAVIVPSDDNSIAALALFEAARDVFDVAVIQAHEPARAVCAVPFDEQETVPHPNLGVPHVHVSASELLDLISELWPFSPFAFRASRLACESPLRVARDCPAGPSDSDDEDVPELLPVRDSDDDEEPRGPMRPEDDDMPELVDISGSEEDDMPELIDISDSEDEDF
ncbi:hypothetical protein AURDEDRAFT_170887 [Auricularia subglabra TFB-10046 SS5]|nr:hypothetical protein AURDEDRAFT_170887 [Auricularia subglabra TFB-10046 SS5]